MASTLSDGKKMKLNLDELKKYEQIREPLLMVDCVTEVEPGRYAKGYKVFNSNEWFFDIHFPGEPNVPGAFQLEALAQLLTITITTLPGLAGMTTRFVSFQMVCKREILPDERMDMEVEVLSWKRGLCKGKGRGYVHNDETGEDEVACEAEMRIILPKVFEKYVPKKG